MTSLRRPALALGITLLLATVQSATAQSPGTPMPQWARDDPIANEGVIEDGAIDAIKEMSNYLMSATTLGLTSQGSLDAVTNDGQRIQLDGVTTYKIRRPGFVIDYESDIKSRRFIYDGKNFTVYSPKLGFYASVPAPVDQSRSTGHDLQQVRDQAAAGGPVPLGRRFPCGSHPGAEVRL